MDVVALISGGKDSCHNLLHCIAAGHRIVALANIAPPQDQDEVDSYMYQTVGHEAIELLAQALDLPLYRATVNGSSVDTSKTYVETEGDEVEDLTRLLRTVKEHHPAIRGVSVGAILSDYQRTRVENICARLNLTALAYLWQRSQPSLLAEMLSTGLEPVVIKVAAMGLNPRKHCGKTLGALQPVLLRLHSQFDLHVCGEGGEYETFTVDGPLFKKRIVLQETQVIMHSDDAIAPVGYLRMAGLALQDKDPSTCPPATHEEQVQYARSLLERAGCTDWRTDDEDSGSTSSGSQSGPPESSQHRGHGSGSETIGDEGTPEKERAQLECSGDASNTALHPGVQCKRVGAWLAVTIASHSANDAAPEVSGRSSPTPLALQASTALVTLQETLKTHGLTAAAVRHVNLTVADMSQFAEVNAEYVKHFGTSPPSRVCIQARLPPSCPLLIEATAFVAAEAAPPPRHMHVQGLSHWAPANIGPYSQAVETERTLFMAGQIGLHPSSMTLPQDGSVQAQAALRSVRRVLQAHGISLANTAACVCFLRDASLKQQCLRLLEEAVASSDEEDERFAFYSKHVSPLSHPVLDSTTFCVVPDLPKHAQVEWHFSATTDTNTVQQLRTMTVSSDPNCEAHVTATTTRTLTFVHASLVCADDMSSPQLPEAVRSTIRGVLDWLAPTCTSSNLLSCRVLCDIRRARELAHFTQRRDGGDALPMGDAPVTVLPVQDPCYAMPKCSDSQASRDTRPVLCTLHLLFVGGAASHEDDDDA